MSEINSKPVPKSAYSLLLDLINETYLDGMDSIQEATSDSDGSIRGIAIDDGNSFVFEYTDGHLEVRLAIEGDSKTAKFAAGKARNCKVGISCGNTCISKSKTCRKKASSSQQEKAKEITALVHVPGKGSPAPAPAPASKAKTKTTTTATKEKKPSTKALEKERKAVEDVLAAMPRKLRGMVSEEEFKDAKERIGRVQNGGDYSKMSADSLATALVYGSGEDKLTLLGVTKKYYAKNSLLPGEMLKHVSKKIHPDVNKDPLAGKAFDELKRLVNGMKS